MSRAPTPRGAPPAPSPPVARGARRGRPGARGVGWGLALLAAAPVAALLAGPLEDHARAAAVLLRFERPDARDGLAGAFRSPVEERDGAVDAGAGWLRARFYAPRGRAGAPPVLLVHGVHRAGIDEPRLRAFARVIASAGYRVVTPELEGLTRYRVELDAVDRIRGAARWLARRSGGGRVGVIGISFGGGLALLAARGARSPIGTVFAIGAHHDLARLARWYAGAPIADPAGRAPPVAAHPYGAGVLMYRYADELFARPDRRAARELLRAFLADRPERARRGLGALTPAGRHLVEALLDGAEDSALRAALRRLAERHARDLASVSPAGRLGAVRARVFLLHGADDPIVASTETRWLARELPPASLGGALVSAYVRHAERAPDPSFAERWELVHLMAGALASLR